MFKRIGASAALVGVLAVAGCAPTGSQAAPPQPALAGPTPNLPAGTCPTARTTRLPSMSGFPGNARPPAWNRDIHQVGARFERHPPHHLGNRAPGRRDP